MKKLLYLLAILVATSSFSQVIKHKIPVVLESTAAASGTATLVAIEADGTLSDSGMLPASAGSGLESVTEVSQGWRLIGRNPANFGNIGLGSIDFSSSSGVSSTRGPTGQYSMAIGNNLENPYNYTLMLGSYGIGASTNGLSNGNLFTTDGEVGQESYFYNNIYGSILTGFEQTMGTPGADLNTAVVYHGLMVGWNSEMYAGKDSAQIGHALLSGSASSTIVGQANLDITQTTATQLTTTTSAYNPRFIVGTGSWNSDSDVGTRRNGFVVMSDGIISAPELSIAEIDTPVVPTGASATFADRILITKEYADANYTGIAGAPSGLEKITETTTGWRYIGTDPAWYGNIGTGATDVSWSVGTSSVRVALGNYSFASGLNTEVSGQASAGFGELNVVTGAKSFASGKTNTVTGDEAGAVGWNNEIQVGGVRGFATGDGNTVVDSNGFASGNGVTSYGRAQFVVGYVNESYTPNVITINHATNRLFTVGIGGGNDGFHVMGDGIVKAPNMSIAEIDTESTALVTREYLENHWRVKLSLNAAQLKTLNSSPIEIIPTPGAGKYIVIHKADFNWQYGTTPFDANTIALEWVSGEDYWQMSHDMNLTSSRHRLGFFAGESTDYESGAIHVSANSNSTLTGDSIVDIYVTYEIITL